MAAGFPVPVTPSPPLSAHPIEVERARIAEEAARRSPAVTQPSILYEDEWIIAVNKPAGRYCEDVLAGVVELLAGCGGCSRLAGSGSVIAVEKNGVGFDSIGAGREATQLPQGDGSVESNQLLADNIRQHEDAEVLVGLNIEAGDGVRENRDGSGPAPRCGEAEVSATRVHIRPDEAKLAKQSRREVGVARDGNVVQGGPLAMQLWIDLTLYFVCSL